MKTINVISTSNAANLGYRALADVAEAAKGLKLKEYRIVGGHMVQLLIHVYPTTAAIERSTADADAGIQRATAAGQDLHFRLLEQGYRSTRGNQYLRDNGSGPMQIDLLVPHGTVGEPEILNDRGFDAIPGLGFAFSASHLAVEVRVLLHEDGDLHFIVPVPDVEAALILKALAWKSRGAPKDLVDISSLLEIVQEHKDSLSKWGYGNDRLAAKGTRKDAAAALHQIVTLSRGKGIQQLKALQSPARLAALIRKHIPAPAKP
ncbi:hypothetical protein ACLRGI_05300 [Paenarthrobacter nitroguajacolicus]|uniref:hypothetical protein n=1 Tax=Paenarthrobacter nitroguajacolicus TaxID=211146 RepID=UPI003AE462B7